MNPKIIALNNPIDHAKILDEASDPLVVLNSDYQFTYANKAFAQALGKPLETIIGNDLWGIYQKDGADMRRDAIKEVFETGQTKVIETIVPNPSGNLYFITTFKPIFDEQNVVISVVAIAKDVTERKQAEEKLRESEANYKQLFDNAPSGIYQVDFRTRKLIKANDVFCEYFGYSQEEITSISPYDIMTEESKKRFFERLNKMVLGEEVPENPEYEVIKSDGKRVWVKLTAKYNYDSEGLTGANVVVHDIDDLKRAEVALRESELWYRMIYNSAPLGIMHFDSSGSIMDFNDNFAKIMGAPRGKLLGFNMLEELRDQAMLKAVNNALSGQSGYYEGEYTSVTGQHKRFQRAIFQTLKGDDGMFIGAVGIFEDITERKQAEANLREAYEIINGSPVVAFLWKNAEGWPVKFVTDNVEVLLGYKAEELTSGKVSYSGTIHPDDIERVAKEVADYSKDQGSLVFDHEPYRIVTKNGKIKWVNDNTFLRKSEKGEITHYQGILSDITERKLVEQQLKERMKEQQALYHLGEIARTEGPILDKTYQEFTDILPQSW